MNLLKHQSKPYLTTYIIITLIILIGIIGNILNIIVFSQKTMRQKSTFRFLFYLSIVDLLVLIICTTDFLLTITDYLVIRLESDFICRLHTFLTYFLTHMSSFILMIVSIDRALIVCGRSFKKKLPILNEKDKRKSVISLKAPNSLLRTKNQKVRVEFFRLEFLSFNQVEKTLLFIAVPLILINLHYLIFLNLFSININEEKLPNNKTIYAFIEELSYQGDVIKINDISNQTMKSYHIEMCYPKYKSNYGYFLEHIWIWLDTIIFSLMPFGVMLACSIIILVEIKMKSKNIISSRRNASIKSKQRNKKLLLMLIVTNLNFVFCSLPLCINIVIMNRFKDLSYNSHGYQIIFHILSYINNSINFIFYILFSTNYRKVLFSILRISGMLRNNMLERSINYYSNNDLSLLSKMSTKKKRNANNHDLTIPYFNNNFDSLTLIKNI